MPLNPVQPLNVYPPISVTLSGIVRSPEKPVQSGKALPPMLVTPFGIVRLPVRLTFRRRPTA